MRGQTRAHLQDETRRTGDEIVSEITRVFLDNGWSLGASALRRVNCYVDKSGYFGGCKVSIPNVDTRCVKMIVFEKKVGDRVASIIVLVPFPSEACKRK